MTEDEIVQEFQRTRRRSLLYGWPPFIGGMLAFVWLGTTPRFSSSSMVWRISLVLLLCVVATGSMIVSFCVCPLCKKVPMTWMRGGTSGVIMNPQVCPNCGARLR